MNMYYQFIFWELFYEFLPDFVSDCYLGLSAIESLAWLLIAILSLVTQLGKLRKRTSTLGESNLWTDTMALN